MCKEQMKSCEDNTYKASAELSEGINEVEVEVKETSMNEDCGFELTMRGIEKVDIKRANWIRERLKESKGLINCHTEDFSREELQLILSDLEELSGLVQGILAESEATA
mgnify:CR=1 FL=1